MKMRFKEKTYGLNLLVANLLQIQLQQKKIPHYFFKNKF